MVNQTIEGIISCRSVKKNLGCEAPDALKPQNLI